MSALVHESREPVFITKNGEEDMVLMSLAQYAELQRKLELYGKLAAAEARVAAGGRGRPLSQVMKTLRMRIREHR